MLFPGNARLQLQQQINAHMVQRRWFGRFLFDGKTKDETPTTSQQLGKCRCWKCWKCWQETRQRKKHLRGFERFPHAYTQERNQIEIDESWCSRIPGTATTTPRQRSRNSRSAQKKKTPTMFWSRIFNIDSKTRKRRLPAYVESLSISRIRWKIPRENSRRCEANSRTLITISRHL